MASNDCHVMTDPESDEPDDVGQEENQADASVISLDPDAEVGIFGNFYAYVSKLN